MTPEDLRAAFEATSPVIDGWRTVLAQNWQPAAGSQLAVDDEVWPFVPMTSLVRLGLGAARENLHAIGLLYRARELFPTATSTLSRSAFIGAGLAVWLLAPDDYLTRQRRALSLVIDDYDQHIKFGKAAIAGRDAIRLHPQAAAQMDQLTRRRQQAFDLVAGMGGKIAVNLTNTVIPAAIDGTFQMSEDRAEARLYWRQMSGAAHALLWHHFGQYGTTAVHIDDARTSEIAVTGDVSRLTREYFLVYQICRRGWHLLGSRSGRPDLGTVPEPVIHHDAPSSPWPRQANS